jgi:hypothetical protein
LHAKEGGYIISGGRISQANVPSENLLAMIDATAKYGRCPAGLKNEWR